MANIVAIKKTCTKLEESAERAHADKRAAELSLEREMSACQEAERNTHKAIKKMEGKTAKSHLNM